MKKDINTDSYKKIAREREKEGEKSFRIKNGKRNLLDNKTKVTEEREWNERLEEKLEKLTALIFVSIVSLSLNLFQVCRSFSVNSRSFSSSDTRKKNLKY